MNDPLSPRRFGRYEVRSVLGVGAFGTVYLAEDPALDDDGIAVKVLAENWSLVPEVRARFIAEARVMRRLRSEHVVRVHDIGETDDDRPFYVMDFLAGGTLEGRLDARGSTIDGCAAIADARLIVEALAAGLHDLHGAGVIHRDLKPSNLLFRSSSTPPSGRMIAPADRLVLSDFGLAKVMDHGSGLTMAGGSPGYMAPEQQTPGARIDERTDLYAATAVIVRVLTGSATHDLTAGKDALRRELLEALRTGMAERPDERFPSANAWRDGMLAALDATVSHEHSPTAQGAHPRRRRLPIAIGLAALLAGGTVAVDRLRDSESFAIEGPTTVEVGDPIELTARHPDDMVVYWLDPNGARVDGDVLSISALSAGRLSVTLFGVDPQGREHRTSRELVAEQPPLDVRIIGPDRIEVGTTASFRAETSGAVSHYWTDWNGNRLDSDPFEITATSAGTLTFTVTATDSRGATKTVERTVVVS